ncbi:MAG: ParB/RepB/Spo0J family partition protein [Oscillospiraceae bacterium]|nr:ParB/RepB/Spo0J family partition protein [Oscillospiraceae bacterium]
MAKRQGGLGKGLDAIFIDNSVSSDSTSFLPVSEISPDRSQPRKYFSDESLAELADSIREHGVLQPILVRPDSSGSYKIVAGERRWRASRLAGLDRIPVIIREMSDSDAYSIALVENLQREDLNPVEEAEGYKQLADSQGWTQEQIASRVGKSRPAVANAMRLLTLPEGVLSLLRDGKITAGHARAILGIPEDTVKQQVAELVAEKDLSVREAERLSRISSPRQPKNRVPLDPVAGEVELSLKNALGVNVKVKYSDGKGTLSLDFYSKEQLFDFANKLGGNDK